MFSKFVLNLHLLPSSGFRGGHREAGGDLFVESSHAAHRELVSRRGSARTLSHHHLRQRDAKAHPDALRHARPQVVPGHHRRGASPARCALSRSLSLLGQFSAACGGALVTNVRAALVAQCSHGGRSRRVGWRPRRPTTSSERTPSATRATPSPVGSSAMPSGGRDSIST